MLILEHVEFDDIICALLEQHGAVIDEHRVIFPEGTRQEEILPRLRYTERYTILLHDGFSLRRYYNLLEKKNSIGVDRALYEQEQKRLL